MIHFNKILEKLENIQIQKISHFALISNATIEELGASMERLQSDDRHPLSYLFPADGNGHKFVEFWSECPRITYQSNDFDVFGVNREGLYLRKGDGPIHYAHTDSDDDKILSLVYCNITAENFTQLFCRFQSLLQIIRAEALEGGDVTLRRKFNIKIFQDQFELKLGALFNNRNYWYNLFDRLLKNEYPVGKSFPYYLDRQ